MSHDSPTQPEVKFGTQPEGDPEVQHGKQPSPPAPGDADTIGNEHDDAQDADDENAAENASQDEPDDDADPHTD